MRALCRRFGVNEKRNILREGAGRVDWIDLVREFVFGERHERSDRGIMKMIPARPSRLVARKGTLAGFGADLSVGVGPMKIRRSPRGSPGDPTSLRFAEKSSIRRF